MKKKLIAVAIATAFAAPAFADNSNVTFYGKAFIDMENVRSSNVNTVATPVSNSITRVSSNASRLGLKGNEELGDDLKAIYQYEVEVDLSGNAGNGWGKTRNSMLGLEGGFGTAFLGLYDTPYKVAHNKIELFDNTTFGSAINLLGRTNTIASGAAAGATSSYNFNDRRKNSLQYWSPKMEGFQLKLAYSPDVSSTATIGAVQGTKQDMLNLSATYENGMFYAAYAYANYNDLNAASATKAVANDKMNGNRLVGAVTFGDAMVGATYERLNSSSVTAANNGTRTAWELVGTYKIGSSNLGLSYVNAGNFGSPTNANGAKQVSLRYGYKFSKRTELYGMYTSLNNDTNGVYNLSGGTPIANSQAGAKLDGFGLGLIHSF
jgi:predicted porin